MIWKHQQFGKAGVRGLLILFVYFPLPYGRGSEICSLLVYNILFWGDGTMIEINPVLLKIADLRLRAEALRGYL